MGVENFEKEINELKQKEKLVSSQLGAKMAEARKMAYSLLNDALKDLIEDKKLYKFLKLRKDRYSKKWVFEISFHESEMINNQKLSETVRNVKRLWRSAALPKKEHPIEESR